METYTIFGFLFAFILFSVSSFQLPHYLNQLFPLMAVISAAGLLKTGKRRQTLNYLLVLQIFTLLVLGLATIFLHIYFFDDYPRADVTGIIIVSWGLTVYFFLKEPILLKRIIIPPALLILSINYYLNRQFYPDLLKYQSESQVAFYIKENNLPANQLVFYAENEWATDFYLKRIIPEYNQENLNNRQIMGKYVFTSDRGLEDLKARNLEIEMVKRFSDFHVTTLKAAFINKKT